MRAPRQIQRRRRGIFVEKAAQRISSSVGAAFSDGLSRLPLERILVS
jgi:hypothetical protein